MGRREPRGSALTQGGKLARCGTAENAWQEMTEVGRSILNPPHRGPKNERAYGEDCTIEASVEDGPKMGCEVTRLFLSGP